MNLKANTIKASAPDQYEFSIIIPVLNERQSINSLIQHIRWYNFSLNYEIIVVDGDSTGSTIQTIGDKNITCLTTPKGRAEQMNAGAAIASGRILIFLHADTLLPPQALTRISKVLTDGEYVAGAFDLDIDSDKLALKYIAARARNRSRRSRIPYGDQAIFIKKDYFENIGKFCQIPIMEDVELMQRIKKRGDKIFIIPDRVRTSARRWEKQGIFYTTFRNRVLVSLYTLGISPQKLAKFYPAHTKQKQLQRD